jgi:HD-GYP domain-containing protein (c-di-GMP phosphodiesterase class II)
MKPLLLTALGSSLSDAAPGRRGDDVEVREISELPAPRDLDVERPTVLALDRTLVVSAGQSAASQLRALAGVVAIVGLGDPGDTEPGEDFPLDVLASFVPGDASEGTRLAAFRGAFRHAAALAAVRRARNAAVDRTRELAELSAIGVALTTERDLSKLLGLILSHARRVTESDAGSLYLVERDDSGAPVRLRFAHSQNHSLPALPFASYAVPIDSSSLAGYAAFTGEPLVIGDVYLLPDGVAYRQNRSFDDTFGYRTKSMLVLPMKTHRDEIIGVLQLINRKRDPDVRLTSECVEDEVVPFDGRCVEVATALASQAAVAIDNGRLYEDIERLFEGFVTAAVTAIESRDPATSGHSGRVASMTVTLAQAVDGLGSGPYRNVTFSREQLRELRYAGLLHDFGKVGVREQVLVKEKKLYPHDLDLIRHRFAYLDQRTELEFERARADLLLTGGRAAYEAGLARLECERRAQREELARFLDTIVQANEPTVLAEGSFEALEAIGQRTFVDFDGHVRPLLEDHELQFLMIRRGNLDEQERREIESHVTHTYRFLEQIPWTRELRAIPRIAYAHHEKLNGRGYPNRATALEIPVQARIMTIADIYDALTATDRPYKRAVPRDRALDILTMEAKEGTIDPELLETFIGARVFEATAGLASGD